MKLKTKPGIKKTSLNFTAGFFLFFVGSSSAHFSLVIPTNNCGSVDMRVVQSLLLKPLQHVRDRHEFFP